MVRRIPRHPEFVQRGSVVRARMAGYVRMQRKLERVAHATPKGRAKYYITDYGLKEFSRLYNIDFLVAARAILQVKKKPITILEIGASESILGIEIQHALGRKNVRLHALSLFRPFSREGVVGKKLKRLAPDPHNVFSRYRVGTFEKKAEKLGRGIFDLVVSSFSYTTYRDLLVTARRISKIGIALVEYESGDQTELETFQGFSPKDGFTIHVIAEQINPHAFHPYEYLLLLKRNEPKPSQSKRNQ